MVAVGAIIEREDENKILLLKRTEKADFSGGIWEDITGRMNQGEEPEEALKREVYEEAGIEIEIVKPLTIFHIYRGEKTPENELVGIIYHCKTRNPNVKISDEHTEYKWLSPQEALTQATHPGVKKDIETFIRETKKTKKGVDYIGVAIGVLMFNDKGQIFLSKRSQNAKNERGTWEMPGGSVEFGETLEDAAKREIKEEFGVDIEIMRQFTAENHFIPAEGQHWVPTSFQAKIKDGQEPKIMEPEKCDEIGWFDLDNLPSPLSIISQQDIEHHVPLVQKTPITVSAGGVVVNTKGQVAVISQKGTSWSLPKGHVDPGEELIDAAKREVYEETGIKELKLIKPLGVYTRYKGDSTNFSSKKEYKIIHMFLFKTTEEHIKPIDPGDRKSVV